MKAKEFAQKYAEWYGIDKEEILKHLDDYLSEFSTIRYSEFPDTELPTDFTDNTTEFDELLNITLWSWAEEFDVRHAPL